MVNAKRKQVLVFVLASYTTAVLISVYFLILKRDALQFHTRDYNYFVEQAARLADPQLSNRFSLNIEGYNLLGLQGIEGVRNLYHAIHAEYFRYTYALLYGIFQDTLPLYIFYCLFFFLPLPFYALLAASRPGDAWKAVVFFTLLFILFPATLDTITADLRPRMLFASAWCLAVLAVYYERPFIEKLVAFCLLPLIREEGIFLGVIVIALNFLRMRGKPGRWPQTLVLLSLDLGFLAAFLAFMNWGGYTRVDALYDPRLVIADLVPTHLPLILGLAFLVAFLLAYFWLKKRTRLNDLLLLLVYTSAIAITGLQAARVASHWYSVQSQLGPVAPWDFYMAVVTEPTTSLVFYITILLLVLLWDYTHGAARKLLAGLLTSLCILFAVTDLAYHPKQVSTWQENIAPARLAWDFARDHDRYRTSVLVDYDTYQAYYNYEDVVVYNRLPLWRADPEVRFYPDNKALLVRLVAERLGYAVVSQASLADVGELARLAGVTVTQLAANDRYVVLQFK